MKNTELFVVFAKAFFSHLKIMLHSIDVTHKISELKCTRSDNNNIFVCNLTHRRTHPDLYYYGESNDIVKLPYNLQQSVQFYFLFNFFLLSFFIFELLLFTHFVILFIYALQRFFFCVRCAVFAKMYFSTWLVNSIAKKYIV